MDPRDELLRLGEPDLAAVDRVWARFRHTRARPTRARRRAVFLGALALAASALVAVWATRPETPRTLAIAATPSPAPHTWSEQVAFVAHGEGTASGTSRDVRVDWTSGTVRVEVTPHTGTSLAVVTPEALVEVVGTAFTVDRGALGTTVTVDHGAVRVACEDGWKGLLEPGTEHTCLPVTAAGFLARAEALLDAGGSADDVLDTLHRGLRLAGDGPVRGELLARRMHLRAATGDVEGALSDATGYLASPSGRTTDVERFAAWLALAERGCDAALPWLDRLNAVGSAPDAVLLAECVAAEDPERARDLVAAALPALDAPWTARAMRLRAALDGAPP